MIFEKPAKFKKPAKPTGPEHDFGEGFFYGDVSCKRCRKYLSRIENTGEPCVSDAHIHAGQVFTRVTR